MIAGHTFEDYRDAFERYHSGWRLERIVTEPEDLPRIVRDSVPEPDFLAAFHFVAYVEEFEEEAAMWIPMHKSELEDKLHPEAMAKLSEDLLEIALEHTIAERRAMLTEEGGNRNGDA